jgi:hypothetical protein
MLFDVFGGTNFVRDITYKKSEWVHTESKSILKDA